MKMKLYIVTDMSGIVNKGEKAEDIRKNRLSELLLLRARIHLSRKKDPSV